MKKIIIVVALFFDLIIVNSQESRNILSSINLVPYIFNTDSIENLKVNLNSNKELQFTKIVENINLSKEQIFNNLLSFFTYNYGSGKSVIQINDKEAGKIVGKGLYKNFASNTFSIPIMMSKFEYCYSYSAYHIIQVDIKESRLRIILTVQNVDEEIVSVPSGPYSSPNTLQKVIGDLSPFRETKVIVEKKLRGVDKSRNENTKGVEESEKIAFSVLCQKCNSTIEEIQKSVKNTVNLDNINSDNW